MILKIIEDLVKTNDTIGVFVSGGVDSTILSYLLHDARAKYKPSLSIKYFCVRRPDDSAQHARRVVDYIDSVFNLKESVINYVGDGSLHHRDQVKSGIIEAMQNYEFDILLTGVTLNPENANPPEMLQNYEYGRFVDPDGFVYNGPTRVESKHPKLFNPFWNYTKKDTVKIIKDFNLVDIPNITHSCTASKTTKCGKCWQCCERAWAFAKNDMIDTGTM